MNHDEQRTAKAIGELLAAPHGDTIAEARRRAAAIRRTPVWFARLMITRSEPAAAARRRNVIAAGLFLAPLVAAAALAGLAAGGISALPSQSLCASILLFGRECAGCGLTRAFVALASGELSRAVQLNPAAPPLFGGLALLSAMRLAGLWRERGVWLQRAEVSVALVMLSALLIRGAAFWWN
jgi:hypothetical protein